MHKVIISLAPVAAGSAIDYPKLSQEIIDCIDEGAAICHLHSRKSSGALTPDFSETEKCFADVLAKREVITQASTGGVSDMNIEERCRPLASSLVATCSLNAGSTNLGEYVYHNSFDEIRYVTALAHEKKILPEIEVFDISMIQSMEYLLTPANRPQPVLYNLVFGHQGVMMPTIESLVAFKSFVPKDAFWGVTHYGRTNWDFLACAITMGATDVRIGFEDSDYLGPQKKATTNTELVTRLAALIRSIGYEVATVKEARAILSLSKVTKGVIL